MTKLPKKKSYKGRIIKDWSKKFIEFDGKDHTVFNKVPRTKDKGSGIYALYDNYGLYYVGLSNSSIRARLKDHTRDHHAKKWKRFVWYHIPNFKYVKDLETALLNIIKPRGNKLQGKIKKKRRQSKK